MEKNHHTLLINQLQTIILQGATITQNTPATVTPKNGNSCMPVLLFIRLLLHISIVAVTGFGLYLNLFAAWDHSFQPWLILFYTTLSNTAVMLLFTWLCISDLGQIKQTHVRSSPFMQTRRSGLRNGTLQLKIALTWAISITAIVWHTLLVPHMQNNFEAEFLAYIPPKMILSFELLHTWSAVLAFADWLLFDHKGSIKITAPLYWLLIPISYLAFICGWVHFIGPINIALNMTYPYPFIDFATYGSAATWKNIALMTAGMLALGFIFYLMDWLLGKLFPSRRHRSSF